MLSAPVEPERNSVVFADGVPCPCYVEGLVCADSKWNGSLPVATSSGQMTLPLRMWALKKKARPKCRAFLYTFRSPERLRANVIARRTAKRGRSAAMRGRHSISFVALLKRHIRTSMSNGGFPSPPQVPPNRNPKRPRLPRVWGLFLADRQKRRRPSRSLTPPQTAAFRQNRLMNRLIKQRSRQTRFAPFAAARDINRKPDG